MKVLFAHDKLETEHAMLSFLQLLTEESEVHTSSPASDSSSLTNSAVPDSSEHLPSHGINFSTVM